MGSLHRHADRQPEPKQAYITHLGGEVFHATEDLSSKSTLWGELFKDNERRFLRRELKETKLTFAIKHTYQIMARILWQPADAVPHKQDGKFGATRKGRTVLCLHGLDGPAATSWCWMKLARPLHQRGFNVVLIDLPGFGHSSVDMVNNCRPTAWRRDDWYIISQIMAELGIDKFHIAAVGASCAAVLRFLLKSPHQLEKRHIFYNPILDFDELFHDPNAYASHAGVGADWRALKLAKQRGIFESTQRKVGLHILTTFDERVPAGAEAWRSYLEEVHADHGGAAEAALTASSLPVEQVSRGDLCEAQAGSRASVRMFFLSRRLKQRFLNFLQAAVPAQGDAEPPPAAAAARAPAPSEGWLEDAGASPRRSDASRMSDASLSSRAASAAPAAPLAGQLSPPAAAPPAACGAASPRPGLARVAPQAALQGAGRPPERPQSSSSRSRSQSLQLALAGGPQPGGPASQPGAWQQLQQPQQLQQLPRPASQGAANGRPSAFLGLSTTVSANEARLAIAMAAAEAATAPAAPSPAARASQASQNGHLFRMTIEQATQQLPHCLQADPALRRLRSFQTLPKDMKPLDLREHREPIKTEELYRSEEASRVDDALDLSLETLRFEKSGGRRKHLFGRELWKATLSREGTASLGGPLRPA